MTARAPGGDGRVGVLYLAPWVIPGGADKGTVDWFRLLDRTRFAPHLITTTAAANNAFVCDIEPLAEAVWNLPDLLDDDEFGPFVLGYVERHDIRVVHIMNCQFGFDLIPALRASRPGLVIVVQQHAEEVDRSGYVRYVATRYSPLLDAYSATSVDLKRRICSHGADERLVRVIYTGIDAAGEWHPLGTRPPRGPSDPLRVLFAGRIEDQKDPALMVDVVAAARRRGIPLVVDVVGEGSLRADTERRARELGVDDVLRFHGVSLAMAPWYEANDVLLMTSRFEGIPYVIFEAMAMELVCVVPDVNANRELLDDSVGFVVDDRTDVGSYVDALAVLAADPGRCAALGAAARRRVLESFPLTRMAGEHMALYDELLATRPD